MTGSFQSAGRPTTRKIDGSRARPVASPLAATLNAAPPVRGLMATAQMLGRRGGHEAPPIVGGDVDRSGISTVAGVVQARLFRGRTPVPLPEDQQAASATVRGLIDADQEYVLRDDEALTDETVHVLERERKYLLGERHDQSDWAARSAHWDVDTMVEGGKDFPEKPVAVGHDAPTQQNQSLESIHAYLLAVLLEWQSWLNMWLETWQRQLVPAEHDDEDDHLLEQELLALGIDDQAQQEPGQDGNVGGPDEDSGEDIGDLGLPEGLDDLLPADDIADALVFSEAAFASLNKEFEQIDIVIERYFLFKEQGNSFPNIDQFHEQLEALCTPVMETMEGIKAMMALPPETPRAVALPMLENINRAPVQALVIAVQTLIGETPPSANTDRIGAVAGGAPFVNVGETTESLTLTNPYREAQMIRNINAARAPLLVKIGNNHVDRVGDAVAESVKVPLDTDFYAMTRRP